MRQLRYYVDTSVWNFVLEDDRPERRQITERLLKQLDEPGMLVISEVVVREVSRAPEARRKALEDLIGRHVPTMLQVTDEVQVLAQRYIAEKIIPPKYLDDALHLAVAVVHEVEVLISWNFEHLVKLKTRLGVNGLNRLLGYREIEIVSPEEVTP